MLFITSWIFYVNNRFWRISFAHISFSALFLSTCCLILVFFKGSCNMLSQVRELILFITCLSTHRSAERTRDKEIIFGPFCSLSISTTAARPNFPRPRATVHRRRIPVHWRLRCSLWLKWLFYTGIRHRYHLFSQVHLKIRFSKDLSAFHHSSAGWSVAVMSALHLISGETIIGHFVLSVKSIYINVLSSQGNKWKKQYFSVKAPLSFNMWPFVEPLQYLTHWSIHIIHLNAFHHTPQELLVKGVIIFLQ